MAILFPDQTWQIIPASQLAGVLEQKVLLVGQMLSGGTATAGELQQDIADDGSEDTLFGQRSHVAGMVREFKKLNKKTRLDVLPLDDSGTAVQATAVVTVTGTATEDGSITISVGSEKNHSQKIDILTDDAAADVGAAIDTAFADDDDSPFQAGAAAGIVTFTAENGGTIPNDWSVKVEGSVAGISVAITAWSGGANDPTLTSVLDAIGDIRYQHIVWPSPYDLDVVETLLNSRFNAASQILDGVAIQVKKGTLASLKTYADQNSQSVVIFGNKTVSKSTLEGTAIVEMPDIIATEFAAFASLRRTDDAPLSQFLTTVATADQFGGSALASLPYPNTLMPNLPIADMLDEFTLDEISELGSNAVSLMGPNRVYNSTILGTVVTTYLTNAAGNPDNSYKFLEVVQTASVIREYFYENFRARYAQTRLTEGDLVAGRDMANESSIRAFCNTLYDALAVDTLVQAGTAAKLDFNQNLVVSVDIATGTVTVNMAPLLVTQLRVVLGTIQINFGG